MIKDSLVIIVKSLNWIKFIDFRAKYVIRWYLGDDLLTDADGYNLNAEVLLTGELMAALGGKSPIGEEVGLNHWVMAYRVI